MQDIEVRVNYPNKKSGHVVITYIAHDGIMDVIMIRGRILQWLF
jgi:hypothetical protein